MGRMPVTAWPHVGTAWNEAQRRTRVKGISTYPALMEYLIMALGLLAEHNVAVL
jgi:hypothetical protein